jgi:N utilization substance protein B
MTSTSPSKSKRQSRSTARLGAVQALYQMDMAETDLSDILADFGSRGLARGGDGDDLLEGDFPFFRELVTGVVEEQRDIDPKVNGALHQDWRLNRLDSTLRALLRVATFELAYRPDVPVKVVINEYVEVARAFFDEEEPKFVNGVLDRLGRELRPAEFT